MKRRSIPFLICIILSAVLALPTRAQPLTFAGLEWGSSQNTVRSVMAQKGYTLERVDSNDLIYSHKLFGYDAAIGFGFTEDDRLLKTLVRLGTSRAEVFDAYQIVVEQLKATHGQPESEHEFYKDPYSKGDGYETQAIRVGKGFVITFWETQTEGMMAKINDQLKVDITYESSEWSDELRRRRGAEAADLSDDG